MIGIITLVGTSFDSLDADAFPKHCNASSAAFLERLYPCGFSNRVPSYCRERQGEGRCQRRPFRDKVVCWQLTMYLHIFINEG